VVLFNPDESPADPQQQQEYALQTRDEEEETFDRGLSSEPQSRAVLPISKRASQPENLVDINAKTFNQHSKNVLLESTFDI